MRTTNAVVLRTAATLACLFLAGSVLAQGTAAPKSPRPAATAKAKVPLLIEQRAIDLIKAASARLAADTVAAAVHVVRGFQAGGVRTFRRRLKCHGLAGVLVCDVADLGEDGVGGTIRLLGEF